VIILTQVGNLPTVLESLGPPPVTSSYLFDTIFGPYPILPSLTDGLKMAYLIFALLLSMLCLIFLPLIAYITEYDHGWIDSYAHFPNPVLAGDQGAELSALCAVLIRFFEILDGLASSISLPEEVAVLD
jgi:hypothetical protein